MFAHHTDVTSRLSSTALNYSSKELTSALQHIRTLVLTINVDASAAAIHDLHPLNCVLRDAFEHSIRQSGIPKVELTINAAAISVANYEGLREWLSPAVAIALSVPESTFALDHEVWPDLVGETVWPLWLRIPIDPQNVRPLLHTLQELRKEVELFNQLHSALSCMRNRQSCRDVESIFTNTLEGFTLYRLKDAATLQRGVDRARSGLDKAGKSGAVENAVGDLTSKLEQLLTLRATRKAQRRRKSKS
ncbi:uncharacterized protein LTR77_006485 [Saxophila tyrrhenica]|uniref:Uncharacterized protein n=1 Tax=Saxophila tyrrhenica TaxID=1690608 RepID=A0AAV9PA74_9PEZI|nr:hypothetical protein LTR77_006485 [Saxophila tyrrhenica]